MQKTSADKSKSVMYALVDLFSIFEMVCRQRFLYFQKEKKGKKGKKGKIGKSKISIEVEGKVGFGFIHCRLLILKLHLYGS